MNDTYIEYDNILNEGECQENIAFVDNLLHSPDGMFNRVFANINERLASLVSHRLMMQGYDMSDKFISSTWYYTVYTEGEQLAPHVDGHKRENGCRSIKTLLIYLNMPSCFDGGETVIIEDGKRYCVLPQTGKGLIMSQDVLHEGSKVTRGMKYILRGDIMMR